MTQQETLDRRRWIGLWHRLGAQGDGRSSFDRLAAAYAEPHRAYHTAEHIRDCLSQFDRGRAAARHPDEIEAALWFHDAVYLPGAPDNEQQSADLARGALEEFGAAPEIAERVATLILATTHSNIPTEPDAALLCDVDLSILGRAPAVFDDFERRIRLEYAWVPEPVYRSARTEILEGFLRRSFIYQTSYFRAHYEAAARANLDRILKELAG